MRWLEHRIPPPLVGALLGAMMYGMARVTPAMPFGAGLRIGFTVVFALVGAAFLLAGAFAFRRARTTVNPLRPEQASALVIAGVYRITRNPMYVGFACLLLAWAAWLAAPWALLGPLLFVAWITRFQILPEERALRAIFGASFDDYRSRVRRWL